MQASQLCGRPAVGHAAAGTQRRPALRTPAVSASLRPQSAAPLKSDFRTGAAGTSCLQLWRPVIKQAQPVATTAAADADAIKAVEADERPGFLGIPVITWKKIVPLGFMFFAILFNYTILRDTKDVLVVTAPGSGAEVIPFLKTWVNLPAAIGFTVLYAKLANILSTEKLFYACIFPFIIFFGAFAFVLYPLRDTLHPTELAASLLDKLGPRFAGPIAILRNWTFCLFYVMAELWGSVVVSLLFWGFANQITTVDEAKQFYPLFGLGANVALIFSGRAVVAFSQLRGRLPPGVDGWGVSLRGLMSMVVVGGLLVAGTYFYLQRTVVPGVIAKLPPKPKKHKAEMGIGESFTFLAKSTYIRDLAALVVAYGISINLVEVTWKSKIKQQFPNPNDYSQFMGNFSTATGAVTFFMMLLSRFIFRKFGWGVAAIITPTVLLITGVIFFALVLFGAPLDPMLASFGLTPLMAAVLVGAAQNVFSKSSKYSLFDPCKEMAYIPLDQETQLKGKAAIDVICNPLGKSGGALIQQVMIVSFGSLAASTPYLGGILLVIVLIWLKSARSLDKQFTELQVEQMRLKKQQQQQRGASGRKYKFVSQLNEQGFIEGKYVLVSDSAQVGSEDVLLASQDVPPGQKA